MKTPDSLDTVGAIGLVEQHSGSLDPAEEQAGAGRTSCLLSPKIQSKHLERLAIVYIRQSSSQQVLNNRESRERQYALVDRAVEFGWPRNRVLVIDEDQGQSGKTADNRNGFQKILVDVSLDHVGIVLGLEMSRMSRSCRDAYQLMEVCAVFATLLADFDGVYDPTDVNDRLLLGLKATISEVELHTMRNRLLLGKLNKARRGELFSCLPMGYMRTNADDVMLDPDEQVQHAIRLVFAKFSELKSINRMLRYFRRTGVLLPVRPRGGPNRGQLEWRRPNQSTLQNILRNPLYAGAYSYGRYRVDPRRTGRGGKGTPRRVPLSEAQVLLKDRWPSYISWDQFQENQRQMAENRSKYDTRGVPRRGIALLAGLLVCGRCGHRLRVSYGSQQQLRYMCCAKQTTYGQDACQSLQGRTLDRLITRQVLRALEPAALELSLTASDSLKQEREQQHKQWRLRLERAQYQSDRAARQYHAVEPENRLVARQLESTWEKALQVQRELEEEYARWERSTPRQLTAEERSRIEQLAQDIPALWNAAGTSEADRKTIVRHLIDQVVVTVEGRTELVQATIHWAGGYQSQHEFRRTVASYQQLTDFAQLLERVAQLRAEGYSRRQVADRLAKEGFRPPHGGSAFSLSAISRLYAHLQSPSTASPESGCPSPANSDANLGPHEWWPASLAHALQMPVSTVKDWRRRGWIRARKCRGWPDRWICYANPSDIIRLRQLRSYQRTVRRNLYPTDLTTPCADSES
jgi:DNA invertase Pin-like site-specific DNA recombinase